MSENTLVPVEQKTVVFYEDEIVVVQLEDGAVYVPIRPICELLGVQWSAQRKRINRDEVLAEAVQMVSVSVTDTLRTRDREMLCLPLDFINGFLFGINAQRVAPEIKPRLLRYQRECYRVLADAFLSPVYTTSPAAYEDPGSQALVQLHNMAKVIAFTTKEMLEVRQMTLSNKSRLDAAREYLRGMNQRLAGVDERLTAVEKRVPRPGDTLTNEQQFEIQDRVKRIALAMAQHDPSKSHFRGVYDSLSLRTRRNSFKDIPQSAYEEAITFLNEWLASVQQEHDAE